MPRLDLTGQTFGRLTVIETSDNIGPHTSWVCRCICGNTLVVRTNALRTSNTTSCGCTQKERASIANRTHAASKTRTYKKWKSMRSRCNNPNRPDYIWYGGRGISVCERWDNFNNFITDMGEAPPDCTIERVDTNGDYTPENCVWATQTEQANNRRSNIKITINQSIKTLTQWCEVFNMPYDTVRHRIYKGVDPITALTTPIKRKK